MLVYILTNGKRNLNESYSQIDYRVHLDKTNNIRRCYIDLLNEVRDIEDDILILEDDLILCRDFINRIENVIKSYHNKIINFFWKPYYKPYEIYTSENVKDFCFTQCVYYPKGSINKFYNDLTYGDIAYDVNISKALIKNNISYIQYRPHLVQHIGDKSLISHCAGIRRSKIFIDDIKKY